MILRKTTDKSNILKGIEKAKLTALTKKLSHFKLVYVPIELCFKTAYKNGLTNWVLTQHWPLCETILDRPTDGYPNGNATLKSWLKTETGKIQIIMEKCPFIVQIDRFKPNPPRVSFLTGGILCSLWTGFTEFSLPERKTCDRL